MQLLAKMVLRPFLIKEEENQRKKTNEKTKKGKKTKEASPLIHALENIEEGIQKIFIGLYLYLVVLDGTGKGPALELVEKPFFEMLARALRHGGVLCNMAESMWLHTHLIQDMINVCCEILKDSIHYAWTSVPTYPSGVIGFILCSTDVPHVHFKILINQIKKAEGALEHSRELKFYNSHISGEASSMRRALFDIASRLHGFLSKTQHLLGNPSATLVVGRLLG
ncbi:spermine synthase-like protein [Tanacetum coccineum]